MTMKTCNACGTCKPVSEFFAKAAKCKPCHYEVMRAYRAKNKAACTATRRKYRQANAERMAELTRKSALKTKYGITPEQYDQMLRDQAGACAICREQPQDGKRLCVDHCHTTGLPRALLCNGCNVGLGAFRDRPDLLRAAAEFIAAYCEARGLT